MEDNIWWTRKARINAESRLLSNHHCLDLLLLWYSLIAVFVSIWLLAYVDNSKQVSVVFTCFSVFILAVTLFGSNARFAHRAAQFKDNYISLQELYFSIKGSSKEDENKHRLEYKRLLELAENHEPIDDTKALVWEWHNAQDKNNLTREPKKQHYILLCFYYLKRYLLLAVLFSLPLLLIYVSFFGCLPS
ncbi:SLATT domain-containing protein [Neptuniibacter sp. 2_MG-2023]|uniref:SLATT domain-containing protein n=1 Tax=Neptuniibacter sp. 2_MG-2023 TaxID=3062671 RepID=UPI0026E41EE0|nr:SLATT domain-containing protein [Neptuniibacter sp. 2_MG-2023]MDO6512597.1 SLATT domain-containing protein [Neptuniibacter sp. 2_MG-2023]